MIPGLSSAAIRRFYDDGFLVLEGLFSREEVAEMAEAAERLRAVGRQLAAALPAGDDEETGEAGELKVEHAGSQSVLGRALGGSR